MENNRPPRQNVTRARQAEARRSTPPRTTSTGRSGTRARGRGVTGSRFDPPKVVMRNYGESATVRETRQQASGTGSTRRRMEFSVGSLGAQMRVPTLPQFRPNWSLMPRLFSLALAGVLAFGLYYLWNSPGFRVQAAEVTGLQRLTAAQLAQGLGKTDTPVFLLNPDAMQNSLHAAFPELSAITVTLDLPNKLAVEVVERIPVIIWEQDGNYQMVDAFGFAFPMREGQSFSGPTVHAKNMPPMADLPAALKTTPNAALASTPTPNADALLFSEFNVTPQAPDAADPAEDAPVISAEMVRQRRFMTPELVAAVLEVSRQAPSHTSLLYSAERGLGWTDQRGWDVYLGNAADMASKLAIYNALVQRLLADGIQPALISVEYVDAPYYRLKN